MSAWQRESACAGMDTELFFSPTVTGKDKAKAVCVQCPVRAQCLDAAMREEMPVDEGVYRNRELRAGVRGGLTHSERWALQFPQESETWHARERSRVNSAAYRSRTPKTVRPARTEAQRAARRERDNRLKVAA